MRGSTKPSHREHRELELRRDGFAVGDAWRTPKLLAAVLLELARSLYERTTRTRLTRTRSRHISLKIGTRSSCVTVILGTGGLPDLAAL